MAWHTFWRCMQRGQEKHRKIAVADFVLLRLSQPLLQLHQHVLRLIKHFPRDLFQRLNCFLGLADEAAQLGGIQEPAQVGQIEGEAQQCAQVLAMAFLLPVLRDLDVEQ